MSIDLENTFGIAALQRRNVSMESVNSVIFDGFFRFHGGKVPIQTVLTFTLLLESYTQRKNVTVN
jgi:hypothetical protein